MLFTTVWTCPFFIKTQWLLLGFPISSAKFRSNSFDNVYGPNTVQSLCYRIHKLSIHICYPIRGLSDPYAISSIRYLIHTLSDLYAIRSITYLIHTLFDPFTIWSIHYLIHTFWSIRYLIHMLSDPYAIWSICYLIHTLSDPYVLIHTLSDPYAIWSIRYLIHTLSDPYLSDPYGCSSAEVPINLSRKTIKDMFCEAKLFL